MFKPDKNEQSKCSVALQNVSTLEKTFVVGAVSISITVYIRISALLRTAITITDQPIPL